jgi:tetratricopeptide (TPR) repeat protein
MHEELEARQSKLVEWSHLRVANLNLARGGNAAETVAYLEDIDVTKRSAVLSEKLGDLYAAQGKPSAAATAYEQALKLETSSLQRLRLRLQLADKLQALDRDEDAFANYEKLLEEFPAHTDKLATSRKLLALAQKLGKTEAAAKYEAQIKALTPPPLK